MNEPAKTARFVEFLGRLSVAPSCLSFEEAYDVLCFTLNAVEDELTTIPYAPERWMSDGRMYPPQLDSMHEVPDRPRVKRFRSRAHNTFIGDNGSLLIEDAGTRQTLFAKAGQNGQEVTDL